MKKIMLILFTLLALTFSTVQAGTSNGLPNVAVIYQNNAKTTYDAQVDQSILENFRRLLPPEKCNYIDGAVYLERLKKNGITDMSIAERTDITGVFEGENVDYIIFMELQPFVSREKITMFSMGKEVTVQAPFKMIDLAKGRYLYNGKFTEKISDSSFWGPVGNKSVSLKVINKINTQISDVITSKLLLGSQ